MISPLFITLQDAVVLELVYCTLKFNKVSSLGSCEVEDGLHPDIGPDFTY